MTDGKLGDAFVQIPPNYSEDDREARDQILETLRELQASYSETAKPYIDALAKIDSKYEKAWMIDPSAVIDPPEWMKKMVQQADMIGGRDD